MRKSGGEREEKRRRGRGRQKMSRGSKHTPENDERLEPGTSPSALLLRAYKVLLKSYPGFTG